MTNYFKYHLLENVSSIFILEKKILLLSIKLEPSRLAVYLLEHIAGIEPNYYSLEGGLSSF